jgi:hypothetical protein
LASAVAVLGGGPRPASGPKPCDVIANWGKDKPVTLSYAALLDSNSISGPTDVPVGPSPDSQDLYNALSGFDLSELKLSVHVGAPEAMIPNAMNAAGNHDAVILTLNKTVIIHLTVNSAAGTLSAQDVVFPTSDPLPLPIPKSALFGKETFALVLADSGAITTVTYAKLTGVAGAVGAAGAVATAAKPQSAADRAADYKSQADEIAQLSRLVRCRAKPSSCT